MVGGAARVQTRAGGADRTAADGMDGARTRTGGATPARTGGHGRPEGELTESIVFSGTRHLSSHQPAIDLLEPPASDHRHRRRPWPRSPSCTRRSSSTPSTRSILPIKVAAPTSREDASPRCTRARYGHHHQLAASRAGSDTILLE
ncbi:hypothetical protein GUJ93_ZPchr0006g43542 [Zizania palustris]|uniref:Uncharacterized protein n=1 Tax=Zizania palustris TaxID=103762 RepID=A0A8J5T7A0_ZIZPA|nr:hypothetical protein GUJ93_ZPchr0006g43542 [Zizania palustris]